MHFKNVRIRHPSQTPVTMLWVKFQRANAAPNCNNIHGRHSSTWRWQASRNAQIVFRCVVKKMMAFYKIQNSLWCMKLPCWLIFQPNIDIDDFVKGQMELTNFECPIIINCILNMVETRPTQIFVLPVPNVVWWTVGVVFTVGPWMDGFLTSSQHFIA